LDLSFPDGSKLKVSAKAVQRADFLRNVLDCAAGGAATCVDFPALNKGAGEVSTVRVAVQCLEAGAAASESLDLCAWARVMQCLMFLGAPDKLLKSVGRLQDPVSLLATAKASAAEETAKGSEALALATPLLEALERLLEAARGGDFSEEAPADVDIPARAHRVEGSSALDTMAPGSYFDVLETLGAAVEFFHERAGFRDLVLSGLTEAIGEAPGFAPVVSMFQRALALGETDMASAFGAELLCGSIAGTLFLGSDTSLSMPGEAQRALSAQLQPVAAAVHEAHTGSRNGGLAGRGDFMAMALKRTSARVAELHENADKIWRKVGEATSMIAELQANLERARAEHELTPDHVLSLPSGLRFTFKLKEEFEGGLTTNGHGATVMEAGGSAEIVVAFNGKSITVTYCCWGMWNHRIRPSEIYWQKVDGDTCITIDASADSWPGGGPVDGSELPWAWQDGEPDDNTHFKVEFDDMPDQGPDASVFVAWWILSWAADAEESLGLSVAEIISTVDKMLSDFEAAALESLPGAAAGNEFREFACTLKFPCRKSQMGEAQGNVPDEPLKKKARN